MSVTTVNPRFYVEAPAVPAPRGGLLDVAPVTDVDPHAGLAGVEYETDTCSLAGLAPGACFPPESVETDEEKTPSQSCVSEGGPYTVYKAIGCDILGEPYDARAREALDRSEGLALERAVIADQLGTPTITLPDAECLAQAVGMLEQYAAQNYSGVPVLWTSAFGATLLAQQDLVFPGMESPLTTILGHPTVVTGALDGEAGDTLLTDMTLYMTGHVHLWRGSVDTYQARDTGDNSSFAVAERTWSATVECFVAQVSVPAAACTS